MNFKSIILDVDECLAEGENRKCTEKHEQCLNRIGSYSCECVDGYKRDLNTRNCELDIEGYFFFYLNFFCLFFVKNLRNLFYFVCNYFILMK